MSQPLKEILIHGMFKSLYHEGYHECNLIELLQRCGTSKGGLYHHFGSKKELALLSVQTIIGSFLQEFWEKGLDTSDPISALETLLKKLPEAQLTSDISFDLRHGSIMNNLLHEMSPLDDEFSLSLKELYEQWITLMERSFAKAIQDQVIKKNTDPRALAEFCAATIEGAITVAKSKGDDDSYHAVIASLITYLNTFRPSGLKPATKREKPISHSLFE